MSKPTTDLNIEVHQGGDPDGPRWLHNPIALPVDPEAEERYAKWLQTQPPLKTVKMIRAPNE
jgi:hypothetical protein